MLSPDIPGGTRVSGEWEREMLSPDIPGGTRVSGE